MGSSELILILLVALIGIGLSVLMIAGAALMVRPLFQRRNAQAQANAAYTRDLGRRA